MKALRIQHALGVAVVLAASALAACNSAPEPTGPADAYVLVPGPGGTSVVRRAHLPVRDVRTLASDAFAPERGSRVHVALRLEGGAVRYDIDVRDGAPLDLDVIEADGAYVAGDYESLVALSSMHHLFVARDHFASLGFVLQQPGAPPTRVFFYPHTFEVGVNLTEDNAFYAYPLESFGILRERVLDAVPLATNQGVMAHEFAHLVWAKTFASQPIYNAGVFTGLNEGLADVHGAAVTGDPAFVARSAPTEMRTRDLAVKRVYDVAAAAAAASNPYAYGAIVASAFWHYHLRIIASGAASATEARLRMARIAYEAIRDVRGPAVESVKPGANVVALYETPLWAAAAASAERLGDREPFCASLREAIGAAGVLEGVCP